MVVFRITDRNADIRQRVAKGLGAMGPKANEADPPCAPCWTTWPESWG
jgi:hypothetical protein